MRDVTFALVWCCVRLGEKLAAVPTFLHVGRCVVGDRIGVFWHLAFNTVLLC